MLNCEGLFRGQAAGKEAEVKDGTPSQQLDPLLDVASLGPTIS